MSGRARDLRIEVGNTTSPTTVALTGEIDLTSSRRLREVLLSIANSGEHRVVVDMSNVTFMDSTGLSALVAARKRFGAMDGQMTIRSPSRGVRRVLEVTGLSRVFTIE